MPDEHVLTLRQADQARSDFYAIGDELEFINSMPMEELSNFVIIGSSLCRQARCSALPRSSAQEGLAWRTISARAQRSRQGQFSIPVNKGSTVPRSACDVLNNDRSRRAERIEEERQLVWPVLRHWKEIAHGERLRAATKSIRRYRRPRAATEAAGHRAGHLSVGQ